jgi:hypothetical protein
MTITLTHPEKFNVDLAQRTLNFVIHHPEQHDQFQLMGQSACGSVGCIAGWAATLAGFDLPSRPSYDDLVEMQRFARDELGLTENEFQLFYANYDRDKAIDIVRDYIDQALAVQQQPVEEMALA